MLRRLANALRLFARTRFTWCAAWRVARPIGDWWTTADPEGNVVIVPGTLR